MDAYRQQHHNYMRPPQPPPSVADLHHYHHQQQQPRPPVPPAQAPWFPNQFQYHHHPSAPPPPPPPPPHPSSSSSTHSPSPPPPQHWAPPPPPAAPSAYPPAHTYPTHLPPQNHQFPPPLPPRPHAPPPPPPPPPPQSYPQANQEWGNSNWGHQPQHQGWDYSVHNNAEDWAARARAWAAAKKVAAEDQHAPSQFTSVGRPEEQGQFHEQYSQAVDSHYQDGQQQPFPPSGYQQYPAASLQQSPIVYPQEPTSFNSGQSFVPDAHQFHSVGGGTSCAAPTVNPSVYQQEVPSSYSSVTGREETADQKELSYKTFALPISSSQEGQQNVQPSPSDPTPGLSDLAPRFTFSHDAHVHSGYAAHDSAATLAGIGPVTPVPSINSWSPAVATTVYPAVPQHDPSMAIASSVPGHSAPPFGSFPGSNFPPTVPSAGAPFALGAGTALHSPAGFPGDAYGVSNISDRPKKASVPNWLKEEIIKNASTITRSSLEQPKEGTQVVDDEAFDNSFGKGDLEDSKSIDSSRTTEEEDDDEDDLKAARSAAINQEIKRVLTEVLLKVTDELFDEIATKVLDEDDSNVEGEHDNDTSNLKKSLSPQGAPNQKASAKVLVPAKDKESETEDASETSSSGAPGNVLGLANYATDDDDNDDQTQNSRLPNSKKDVSVQQPSIPKVSEDMHYVSENGNSQGAQAKSGRGQTNLARDMSRTGTNNSPNERIAANSEVLECVHSPKVNPGARDAETGDGGAIQERNVSMKKSKADDSQARETMTKSGHDNRQESRKRYSRKDIAKEAEGGIRTDEKEDDKHRRQDEKHSRKERADDHNGWKERVKERGDRTGEKAKEPESRRRSSHVDVKEDRKEVEKLNRTSSKDDLDRKRERVKDTEEDRGRHKPSSDHSRHKRRRSSSTGSRGRNSKDNDSSDEASDDPKRKVHSRKRRQSPSPDRSRRRQVSRSPHSKHSERRHSPYSVETTRGRRRSRSRSPPRRHK